MRTDSNLRDYKFPAQLQWKRAGSSQGRIVASCTGWPVTLNIGGELVKGAQTIDTMTDPDYRRQGLFKKVAVACYDLMAAAGYEVLYGFPNDNVYHQRVHSLNWNYTGNGHIVYVQRGAILEALLVYSRAKAYRLILTETIGSRYPVSRWESRHEEAGCG
jgi:hypothetical protein